MSDYKENRYIQQVNEYDYLKEVIKNAKKGKSKGILAIGPPGMGKTLLFISLAKELGVEYFIIDGGPELDRTYIEGNWEITKEEGTVFTDGQLTQAFKSANENGLAFLIVNEINAIRESEQISLNSTLSESHINLISDAGRRVELNKDAKLIIAGTMNKGVLGVNPLQEAFEDRFDHIIILGYPSVEKEIEIITKISDCKRNLAKIVVETASNLRTLAITNMAISKIFSTRLAVNFSHTISCMGTNFLKENIKTMIVNKITENEEEISTVEQTLTGKNFEDEIRKLFDVTVKEEPEKEEPYEEIDIDSAIEKVKETIKFQCMPSFAPFRGGKLTYQLFDTLQKACPNELRKYFMLTKTFSVWNDYEKETSKSVIYGGELTFQYIYWLYRERMPFLIKFMTREYPVIEVKHY